MNSLESVRIWIYSLDLACWLGSASTQAMIFNLTLLIVEGRLFARAILPPTKMYLWLFNLLLRRYGRNYIAAFKYCSTVGIVEFIHSTCRDSHVRIEKMGFFCQLTLRLFDLKCSSGIVAQNDVIFRIPSKTSKLESTISCAHVKGTPIVIFVLAAGD